MLLVVPPDESTTMAPVVAKIDPPIKAPAGTLAHLLGMIYLSDYHVMDCPLAIHEADFGLFAIGDHTRTRTSSGMKIMTSLNHTVHFHAHDGFRADELVYVEATSPWAKDGRALIHSKMFSHNGLLIATCVQEVSIRNIWLYRATALKKLLTSLNRRSMCLRMLRSFSTFVININVQRNPR